MQMKKHWKLLGILLILITGLSCSDNESFEYNNYAEEPTVYNTPRNSIQRLSLK